MCKVHTWTWHGVTQHSHCARMSIRKVAARVMLFPLIFALHCTISHIGCGPPHPICFLGKPHFWSDGCSSTFALFLFGATSWLTLKLHGPPVLPRNNTPPPRYAANAMPVDLHRGVSKMVVHLIIEGFSTQLRPTGPDSVEHYQVCRTAMIPLPFICCAAWGLPCRF